MSPRKTIREHECLEKNCKHEWWPKSPKPDKCPRCQKRNFRVKKDANK